MAYHYSAPTLRSTPCSVLLCTCRKSISTVNITAFGVLLFVSGMEYRTSEVNDFIIRISTK